MKATTNAIVYHSEDLPQLFNRTPTGKASNRILGDRLVLACLTSVALLPVLAVVACRSGRSYFPVQDFSIFDLRVRDVWSGDIPLVGAYGRFGWNHPGPWAFYFMAPLSLLAGKAAWATQVAAALLEGVPLVWGAALAYRKRNLAVAAAWLAAVAFSYRAFGAYIILQPWNPHIAYPWFGLFLLQTWLLSAGSRDLLPGWCFTSSFLIGTHVGYALFVALAGLWIALPGKWAGDDTVVRWRDAPWVRAVVVTAVLWTPPIVDCVIHPPGSLVNAVRFFAGLSPVPEHVIGFQQGARLMARVFAWPPVFSGRGDVPVAGSGVPAAIWWLAWPVCLLLAAWFVAHRKGDRGGRHLALFALLALATGVVSIGRITDAPGPYLFYWQLLVATFVPLVGLVVLVRNVGPDWWNHRYRFWRWSVPGVAALVILLGVSGVSYGVVKNKDVTKRAAAAAQGLLRQLEEHHLLPPGPFLLRVAGASGAGVEAGMGNQLLREGYPVRFDPVFVGQVGTSRLANQGSVGTVLYVSEDGWVAAVLAEERPDARLLASYSPLPPPQEQELVLLQRSVYKELRRHHELDHRRELDSPLISFSLGKLPGINRGDVNRIATLNQQVLSSGFCRCAVFSFPSRNAPDLSGLRAP